MSKKPMKYYVVDAFTESAFKGNPAAVCLLEEERDDEWLQALAAEFNISMTCYLNPIQQETEIPRFHLRWFSPIVEVVVASAKNVTEIQPQFDAIFKLPVRGVSVSGVAPPESGFDFYSRFFCPKIGINEDPVCGTAHLGMASYWSKKLGKCDLKAYQTSTRGGVLNIYIDEQKQRVFLRGKAIIVMEGFVLV